MPTVADLLADAAISRALILERIKNGMSRQVAEQYQDIIDEIVKQVKLNDDRLTMTRMNKLIKELKAIVETDLPIYQDLEDLGLQEASWAATSVNTAVGVDIVTQVANKDRIEKIVNASLIEGATIKEWFNSLDASMQTDLERAIKMGVSIGEDTKTIAERVQNALLISKRQAETLTRTAVATTSDQARNATWEEHDDIFKGWEHLSVLDSRTSKTCGVRDGALWSFKTKEGLNEKGKMFNFRRPPLHMNCRSVLLPILKSSLQLGISDTRATMDGQVPSGTSFEDWFKNKPKSFQEEYLGKGRFELYKAGKITFSDLVNQQGRELSLQELMK